MATTPRLRGSADIRQTIAMRHAAGAANVVVHARRRDDDGGPRVAIVAGRRVGNAVVRNRAKRRLRAAVSTVALPDQVDLVISAKAGADIVAFQALCDDLRGCVRRAVRRTAPASVGTT